MELRFKLNFFWRFCKMLFTIALTAWQYTLLTSEDGNWINVALGMIWGICTLHHAFKIDKMF